MKILSVTISGFKNLQKSKINLGRIVAIVSPNNYGKSNFLEAIDFGIYFISASEKVRKTMMSYVGGIPINNLLAMEDFFFEIEFDNGTNDEYRYVKYGYSFSWYRDDGSGQRITDEWLEARPGQNVKYTKFLDRKSGKYKKKKYTNSYRTIRPNSSQLSIDLLSAMNEIAINPIIKSIKHLDYNVCSSLDLDDRFQPMPIDYVSENDEIGSVCFDDRDVPRAIYKLKQMYPEKYQLFIEAIHTLFPDFSDITVESYSIFKNYSPEISLIVSKNGESDAVKEDIPFKIRDEIYRIYVKSKSINQPMDIARMSTGTKRIFWLLANIFIASTKKMCFIGVEELETSIHPRLLKNLLEILDEALEDTSIIISSHSPFLIQYIKPDKIYVGCPNDNGIALFKRLKNTKSKQFIGMAKDNGMSLGEYIFELLSGDPDNENILSFYLEG